MAIDNINTLATSNTFNHWLNTTNQIIGELQNVVTMGADATANNDDVLGVTLDGPLTTKDSTDGIKTNMLKAYSGTTLEFGNDVATRQQYILTPAEGKNDILQFVTGTDSSNTSAYTWRAGPGQDHESFEITGKNADGANSDSIFEFTQPSGTTKGTITGTNIVIDSSILPADVAAGTANKFNDATTVQFGGNYANTNPVGGNIAGTFSFDGSETENIFVALTVDGLESGTVTSVSAGSGLQTNVQDGGPITLSGQISHGNTSSVVNTTNGTSGPGYAVKDLTFDTFGHVQGTVAVDFDDRYIKAAPSSGAPDAADGNGRTLISDQGLLIDTGTKLSFKNTSLTSQGAESFIEASGTNQANSSLIINATGGGLNIITGTDGSNALAGVRIADSSGNNKFSFITANGHLTTTGDITAFGSASDKSLKENIEPITGALDKVDSINGYTFNYIAAPEKGRVPGVIAQELEKVLPEAVYEAPDGTKAVRYDNTVALLIEAIKELKARVDELEGK